MTSTETKEITLGTLTAELDESFDDNGHPVIRIKSNKNKTSYVIKKSRNGFSLYDITCVPGQPPKELTGSYSRTNYAVEAVLNYLQQAKQSTAAKYEERKASK